MAANSGRASNSVRLEFFGLAYRLEVHRHRIPYLVHSLASGSLLDWVWYTGSVSQFHQLKQPNFFRGQAYLIFSQSLCTTISKPAKEFWLNGFPQWIMSWHHQDDSCDSRRVGPHAVHLCSPNSLGYDLICKSVLRGKINREGLVKYRSHHAGKLSVATKNWPRYQGMSKKKRYRSTLS